MDRRTFLSTLAGGASVGLAGCASPLSNSLDSEVDREGDGETAVRFTQGGTEKATVTYLVSRSGTRVRFLVSLSHALAEVETFRLRFRPERDGDGVPPTVALERPDGYPYPPYRFQGGEGPGWTRFEVPDLQAQASGTFTATFWFLHVASDASLDVQTDLHAELVDGTGLRTYTAEARTTADGPPAPDGGN